MASEHASSRDPEAFQHLSMQVQEALNQRGFTEPTNPQERAIPPLSAGKNVLVAAPTGSGKTETAMLPVFDAILNTDPAGMSALLITPLRSLNRDLLSRLKWWGETLDIAVEVRHGDTSRYQRRQQAENPPDVLITTPETLQAMLTGARLREALSTVEHVVVDEVHEIAGSKRGCQLAIGLERLRELAGAFQRVGLSATVGDPDQIADFLTGNRDCEIVEINAGTEINVKVVRPEITNADEELAQELMTESEIASHLRAIESIVDTHESTLIFVNTRQTAEALGSRFNQMEVDIGVHHGSLAKSARIDVETAFKEGELDALLCTSSMELGIDIGRIDHVIQYSSPRQVTRLLQRIGRAGHQRDEVSHGTIICTSADDIFESLAIAERANKGDVEPAEIHYESLDTVANQIVGMVMGYGELRAMHAYQVISRAHPVLSLTENEFKAVVEELAQNRVIWLDKEMDQISKRNGTWQYFYSNLSMIPDESTYEVSDLSAGKQIGTLDERFVVNFAEPGEIFIQQGKMWRITSVDEEEETVQVSPIEDPGGEIPSWTGEEIPVPFEVAQDVGEFRAMVNARIEQGDASTAIASDIAACYPTTTQTIETVVSHLEAQEPMPTHDQIVIEGGTGRELVVNACFGHKLNETLGRLIAALLGQQSGSSIAIDIDPYRITMTVPRRISNSDVKAVLLDTAPEHLEELLELSLKHADMLKFRLAQVAIKFGRLDDSSSVKTIGRDRFLEVFRETPAYDEAVRAIFQEDFDIPTAETILNKLQAGDISIKIVGERTAVGTGGRAASKEFLAPENADASVVKSIQERIQNDDITLFCVYCQDWQHTTKIRRVQDQPTCPTCESTRIAALNPWIAEDVVQAITKDEVDEEEERLIQRAYRSASLVQAHGKKAVIAMAGRGIGPHNAARVINKLREDEDDFYRDILEREKEYARTKAFWD